MKTLSVYDPALCCSTGVCGTDVDQALVTFSADVDWLKKRGVTVARYNLAQQPMAFINNALVKNFLENSGAEGLPLLLLDGEFVMAGRYPTRADLARWCKLPLEITSIAPKNCCGGNTSCC
ncbi:arsenite efflux transporter metallochaperone ArsD [Serratia sp. DD3]|uniref:arsenite efflux transporter metallochaperone ArsD n=1 Tax=Serratia sp. DD3 TaxID=1410619 RepID=UPI0003C4E53D|nr:arsenite efflux transporter metallochaperone ArsD [Serratia sp. DD3]KEY58533.1 arsenical resistance operon trans-acting repressor ArsD [Serratia sp. DD3]